MFGLFEPPYRRLKDEREIRHFYIKYGEDAVAVLKGRANDSSLTSRDRRHWQRLARKAHRHQSEWMGELKTN